MTQFDDLFETDIHNIKLIQYIENILKNEDKLQEIASRSFTHGAGFIKIIIGIDEINMLRLHFWNKYDQIADPQNPHSHGWNLKSKILKGRFNNLIYVESDTTDNVECRNKYSNNLIIHNNSCNFKYIMPVNLLNTSIQTHTEGNVYSMSRTEIHKFVALEKGITLSLRELAHDDMAFIYAKTTLPTSCVFPTLTANEVASHLSDLLHLLNTSTPNI